MGKRGALPVLDAAQREWVWEKWREGYRQEEIADALYCSIGPVKDVIRQKKREAQERLKRPLVWEGEKTQ